MRGRLMGRQISTDRQIDIQIQRERKCVCGCRNITKYNTIKNIQKTYFVMAQFWILTNQCGTKFMFYKLLQDEITGY